MATEPEAQPQEAEPQNVFGNPFFPPTITMLACPQCIEARPWPLNCGHGFVAFYSREYARTDLPRATGETEKLRELLRRVVESIKVNDQGRPIERACPWNLDWFDEVRAAAQPSQPLEREGEG
jgi:hypothetical protein